MPNTGPRIRLAARDDIPQIEQVSVEAYEQYRALAPSVLHDTYVDDLRSLARYWNEAEVFVAEISGEIVGSVMFYEDASTEGRGLPATWAGFRKLAVRPAGQGRGIGKMLVQTCIVLARAHRADAIGIHTAPFMEAACHLYDSMGFRRRPDYDLKASQMVGIDMGTTDITAITYALDLLKYGGGLRKSQTAS